ncbi:hypothetical protein RRF57_006703 [Xylaria bambusicola]|uniref:Uncharacterized protein n=1 Tax=Xylaria bambusicola TaxID=326684 RepID=A0AAN7UJR0_9PEZI
MANSLGGAISQAIISWISIHSVIEPWANYSTLKTFHSKPMATHPQHTHPTGGGLEPHTGTNDGFAALVCFIGSV